MTTLERLKRGRERLERGWCKGAYARDKDGYTVNSASDNACQWCAMGAIFADADEPYEATALGFLFRSASAPIPDFNDSCETVAPVLALYDRAIALCEKESAHEPL